MAANEEYEYHEATDLLTEFGPKLEALISELILADALVVHTVAHRVKSRHSATRKIQGSGSYQKIGDLPDLLGLRIITHYEDEVDAVAQTIEREFRVNPDGSSDRRATIDPTSFGYISVHYMAALDDARSQLGEYRRFADCWFEVQIRSVLQHAWAEIEHDLGYKGEAAIPREHRRRFARLAGLLEVADGEFSRLRDDVRSYSAQVRRSVVEGETDVGIDQDSMLALMETSRLMRAVDTRLLRVYPHSRLEPFQDNHAADHAIRFSWLGLRTVGEVESALDVSQDQVVQLAERWVRKDDDDDDPLGSLAEGISLFYLGYLLVGRSKDLETVTAYFEAMEITMRDDIEEEEGEDDAQLMVAARLIRIVADLDSGV